MRVTDFLKVDAAVSFSFTSLFWLALALQLMTPYPFLPGIPLPTIGLGMFFIVLFVHQVKIKNIQSLIKILIVFFLILLAIWSNDILIRLGLCLVCLFVIQQHQSWFFNWLLFWWIFQLLFNLIPPVHYVVHALSSAMCYAAWIIGFGWIEPRMQFSFGPDIAQVHLFILWCLFFLATASSLRQIKFKNLLPILLSILIIAAELNYLNAAFSDFNIQLVSAINFILFPVIFLYIHKRQNLLPV